MRFGIACVLFGLAMAISATAAVAQVATTTDGDTTTILPDAEQTERPALFLRIVDPIEDDVEVPLATETLLISGVTLPDAVLSVDGELVDVDEQGGFVAEAQLDEGANEIEIVASDADGNQVTTALYVVRGDG